MDTLTIRQRAMATALIDWARERKGADLQDLVIPEDEFARQLGDAAWLRGNLDDLYVLCAYCNAKGYPLVPLLVVIPGLNKPEKPLMAHAFKATLPPAENARRWDEALRAVKKTPMATWKEFRAEMNPE